MPSSPPPLISVVIPVYNGGAAFQACLRSLDLWLPPAEQVSTEVIIVADGCTDGSDQWAEKLGFTVLSIDGPSGPARGRNIGARHAGGDILFFIDADVTIHAETIPRVAALFTEDKRIAAAIGSYDDSPGAANFLSQYKNLFHHYTHQTGQEEASTFWGACGAVRRDVFWAVGGFDESYRKPSIEDIELGYRLKHHGHHIRLCKDIHVKHLKRWEPVSLLRAEIFYRALPWTELLLRQRYMLVNDLNLNISTRISVLLTFMLVAAVVLSTLWPGSILFALIFASALTLINWPVYQFFSNKRGKRFALQVIPWHWLYFGYCGLGYGIGIIRYYLNPTPAKN